jgi:hypothetical protein
MILQDHIKARSFFMSSIESVGSLPGVISPNITEGVTLKLNNYDAFFKYVSAVFSLEPIVKDIIELRALTNPTPDKSLDFRLFMETTKQDNKYSFYFQSTDFAHKVPLRFNDLGFLGDTNVYKPYDSSDLSAIDTMITSNLAGIKHLSSLKFQLRTLRGITAFFQADYLPKGYTFFFTDRSMYMVILSMKELKNGGYNYLALLHTKG